MEIIDLKKSDGCTKIFVECICVEDNYIFGCIWKGQFNRHDV